MVRMSDFKPVSDDEEFDIELLPDDNSSDEEDSESENQNLDNYKGIYFKDDPGTKYTDPESGAHFDFNDICSRLVQFQKHSKANAEHLATEAPPAKITHKLLEQP